ncbi:HlyD family efflux transporter periplasmic adaptor subunit [Cyanobium sp. HWJ4-Hawea]|uniref:HlyD family secretion protein n=1 Tax=Cyanobium sp. HWJ4-Hawea TaxID=2823713 RepID=UPI0020CF58BD|nr:HlyD family efflux transporter periplasmic adaptor subunit [Cyanobium sp. HWJ4-Hawea]MCP9808185.1 HlyD family efflux transporter periplasmic adaptor subunit [Cyanobium sp. HWJ4-Hawea]
MKNKFFSWFGSAQNLLEKSVSSSHQKVLLKQSPSLSRTLIWSLMGTTAFGLLWLSFAKTEEVVVAPGKLEPIGDVKTVQMPQGGVLRQMLVKEGQRVKRGQILLKLDDDVSLERQVRLAESIASKNKEIILKSVELQRYLDVNTTEQKVAEQALALDSKILSRLVVLSRQGAAAELQVLQQRSKVEEDRGRLASAKADRLRQIAILNQQIEALRSGLSEISSRFVESRVANRYQDIRSPVDGVVFDLKPTGPGFVGQGSEPVMKIVPFDALQAKVEVPSDKIGFVRVGQLVDITIDSFPSSDFGALAGVLKSIGSDALPPDQLKQQYRFPVNVRLDAQRLKLKSGQSLPLQVGMSLTANIKLRKVTYLQLLLSDFKDKTDSLKSI